MNHRIVTIAPEAGWCVEPGCDAMCPCPDHFGDVSPDAPQAPGPDFADEKPFDTPQAPCECEPQP